MANKLKGLIMSLKYLKRLSKLKRISEFVPENLISGFGLYESAVIDLRPEEVLDDDEPRIDVNADVGFLQSFLLSKRPMLLPCPDCRREITFNPKGWGNPRNLENTIPIEAPKKKSSPMRIMADLSGFEESGHHNVFEVSAPYFHLADKTLVKLNVNDLERIKNNAVKDELINACISQCRDYFIQFASEIRRDYWCSLDASHRLFVNFRIYDPIEPEDIEEYSNEIEGGEDELIQAYEYLHDCLIIQKVGQYPSLADMQMFDVERYRSVLGKGSYRDLTRAIGLNASGIGCGSFLYLRRILERLVEEAYQEVKTKETWDEDTYQKSRFNERIQLIEDAGHIIIPDILKDVKSKIYGVLSKGVHENTDDECMELFPYMQFVIEQILDERIRKKELDQKVARLKNKLNS